MKAIVFLLISMLTGGSLLAQSDVIRDFQNKYKDTGKYFSIRIEGGLLKTISDIDNDDPDSKDLVKLIRGIDGIEVRSISKSETGFGEQDYNSIMKKIRKDQFEDLMVVKDSDGRINFMVRETHGMIHDLVMLVNNADEFLLMNVSGDIDLHALARLSKNIDFKGSEDLQKLDDH